MRREILKYIVCPINHDVLSLSETDEFNSDECNDGKLISTSGIEYNIQRGIANLIPFYTENDAIYNRDTLPYDQILVANGFTTDWISKMDSLRYSIFKLTDKYIKKYLSGIVLEIGAGGNHLKNIYKKYSDEWISSDYDSRSKTIDLRADGQCLPIKDNCIDTVISIDVLEHIPEPEKAIKEIYRVLKPNGIVILSTPFFFWLHEEPFDFHRFSKYGLKNDFEKNGFNVIEIEAISGVFTILGILISILITKTFRFSGFLLKIFLSINKFLQLYILLPLDKVIDKRKRLAQGHFIIAQK